MTYTFDEERTLDAMAYASTVDLIAGQVTLYGVFCIGNGDEPHFSHGGQLTLSAAEAIQAAKDENEGMAEVDGGCRYLPAAMGIHPGALVQLAHLLGHGFEEPGDDD